MKTLETPNQSHLLNYGCPCRFAGGNDLHVSFNKQTGEVEQLTLTGPTHEHSYSDLTHKLTPEQKKQLATHARKQYKEQYGHLPEHQPASDN